MSGETPCPIRRWSCTSESRLVDILTAGQRTRSFGGGSDKETDMPIVTIQITREGATPEQKAAIIKGATDLLSDVLNKPPAWTFVVIQEVELED
jgi:4-oxalocrotonate tautomerase